MKHISYSRVYLHSSPSIFITPALRGRAGKLRPAQEAFGLEEQEQCRFPVGLGVVGEDGNLHIAHVTCLFSALLSSLLLVLSGSGAVPSYRLQTMKGKKKNHVSSGIKSTHIFAEAPLCVPLRCYNNVSNLSP